MHGFILVVLLVLGTHYDCKKHMMSKPSCTCDRIANFTLVVHCDDFKSGEILECFIRHEQTESLIFRNSHLKKIPDEISILKKIKHLDISYNDLTELDFSNAEHICALLRYLNVECNNITVLRKGSLDCFSNLQTLIITNNSLKMIEPGTFNRNLTQFHSLYAQYNNLVSVDSSLISMIKDNLNIIVNVSFNAISYVTNSANLSIADFDEKKSFYLEAMHNNMTRINVTYYKHLFNVTNILQLYNLWNCGIDIRFNPFICDCSMYQFASMLKIFRHMDPNNPVFSMSCYSPPSLRGMKVYTVPDYDFNCTVLTKCPDGCSCSETISLSLLTVACGLSYSAKILPTDIPAFNKINFIVKNSELRNLDPRWYLKNVSILDVSQNKIEKLNPKIIPELEDIQTVYLNDNLIHYMPQEMETMNFTHLSLFALEGNPFECDCHSLWFKKWLLQHKKHIPKLDKILCTTGMAVISTADSEFVCNNPRPLMAEPVVIVVGSVLVVGVVASVIVRFKWTSIQVFLIATFGIYWFRRKVKTNLKYDIFLSNSSHDDDVVSQKLIPRLENHEHPFKICRGDRDFRLGKTIAYNIISNIESSLTTLLVISNNFLRSEWCKMEFKQAHMKLLQEKNSNLIMIILEDLDQELMDKELTCYIRTHVYLRISDKYFWAKLFQALPRRQKISNSSSEQTSTVSTPVSESNGITDQSLTAQSERTPLLTN